MKKILFISLLPLFFYSCNAINEDEIQAVDKVLEFYGGVCKRSLGYSNSNGKKEANFGLEINESKLLDSYINLPEIPSSNIAYVFYTNLKESKDKYTHIKTEINFTKGKKYKNKYSVERLKEVQEFVSELASVSELVKKKNYQYISSLFDTSIVNIELQKNIRDYSHLHDSLYGEIASTQFQGFVYLEDPKTDKTIIQLIGISQRKKTNKPLVVFIDRQTRKLLSMKFDF